MGPKIDLSQIVWLRERLIRASLATKFAGTQAGLVIAIYLARLSPLLVIVGLAFAWAGFPLAKGLRRGSERAAKILTWAVVPYASYSVYGVITILHNPTSYLGSILGLALWVGSTYCLLRGLLAIRVIRRAMRYCADPPLMQVASPWEPTAKIRRPKAFANKPSLVVYVLLLLVPLPWLVFWLDNLPEPAEPGHQIARAIFFFSVIVPMMAFVYRRARRHAVQRATDVTTQHDRPIVLYLRSFGDDKVRMRGRPTNGRSWLESVSKIRFEEIVVDHLFRYGPVVAVGRPGEGLRPLGAARDYLTDDAWQARVEQLMTQACTIVLVAGRTAGLGWELRKIIELDLLGKLVLLFPPAELQDLRARWASLCDNIQATAITPSLKIDLRHTRAMLLQPTVGPVSLMTEDSTDWSYEVTLDAAVRLLARPELTNLGTDVIVGSEPRLAGVPTDRTDWVGRIVRGFYIAFVIWILFHIVQLIGIVIFNFSQQALVAASIGSALFAGGAWLMSTRWFPGPGRERTLMGAVGLVPIAGALLGAGWMVLGFELVCFVYAVYFAIRRDRVEYRLRSKLPLLRRQKPADE
jgi:hypothetical protein